MIGDQVRRYVVSISQEDAGTDHIYGPYTKRKARELSAAFNEQIERGTFEGEGYIYSTAEPIQNPQSVTAMLVEFGKKPRRAHG